MQVPSKVSAIKIDGMRSYKRAREGEEFEIPARPVTVSSFSVYDVRDAVAEDGTPVARPGRLRGLLLRYLHPRPRP